MAVQAFWSLTFLFLVLLYIGNGLAFSTKTGEEELISLYDENDSVIELVDANFTSAIHDTDVAWVVEFYAHWCGYCQRFSPLWKKLASEFDVPGWKDTLKFGAINCAQQSTCGNYSINGTPTLRLFYGGPGFAGQGIDIPVYDDNDNQMKIWPVLLQQLEKAQGYGYLKSPKIPNFLLVSGLEKTPEDKKMIAYVVEDRNLGTLGRDIVFYASKRYPQLETRRMDWMYARNSIFQYRSLPLPSVILVPVDQNTVDWNKIKVVSPTPVRPTLETYRNEILHFIHKTFQELEQENSRMLSTTTTTTPATTSTIRPEYNFSNEIEEVVHMADLERAINYVVETEISTKEKMDEIGLKTIYQMLENMVRYLPLRKPVRDFLIVLRDWPSQMEFKELSGQHYKEKVEELLTIHKPFLATPDDWVSCKGSEPQFRGYPCSLWQLFHSMMVNAAARGDPSMALGGTSTVAKTMIDYVFYFFSCRHCAENFRTKVHSMGFLPSTPRDSILWLWQIHNMANIKLRGDPTEDPTHPKIIWPSEIDCPDCRSNRPVRSAYINPQIAFIHGTFWNLTALVDHHYRIYGADELIKVDPSQFQEKRLEALEHLKSSIVNSQEYDGFANEVDNFCSKYAHS